MNIWGNDGMMKWMNNWSKRKMKQMKYWIEWMMNRRNYVLNEWGSKWIIEVIMKWMDNWGDWTKWIIEMIEWLTYHSVMKSTNDELKKNEGNEILMNWMNNKVNEWWIEWIIEVNEWLRKWKNDKRVNEWWSEYMINWMNN